MSEAAPSRLTDVVAPETIQRLQATVPGAFAMLVGMQLEVFTHLADGPRSAAEIATGIGVADERLSRLLYALVVAGLLEVRDSRFANTPEAAVFLVKGLPGYIGAVHELLDQLWHADLLTARSIRSGQPAAMHDFAAASDDEMAAMLRGMHSGPIAAARELLQRFDFTGCRSLIDVAGGSGGLVATLCAALPELDGTLFELPRTASLAEPLLRDTPGGDRVVVEVGDILAAPPSGMHDTVTMRALIQVLGPADAARAIVNAAASLRPGGAFYIIGGGILDDDRLAPRAAVFWNVTFMNLYPAGASYTEAEHAAWLAAAGCRNIERVILPSGGGIIRATKHG
jgi:O-methyltransferase domain/Dimerisation domain